MEKEKKKKKVTKLPKTLESRSRTAERLIEVEGKGGSLFFALSSGEVGRDLEMGEVETVLLWQGRRGGVGLNGFCGMNLCR
jgi:hypothetical protein